MACDLSWCARLARRIHRPALFAAVGGVAFGVDMTVLGGLVHGLGLAPAIARGLSILAALSVAWYINRRVTFAAAGGGGHLGEWLSYLAVNALGMGLNYGIYVAIVSLTRLGAAHPLLSVVPGGVLALGVNYGLASRLIFRTGEVSSHR
ncbi:GtrA family protein [Salinisphaera sp. Q1T1-3]|uniref:GtrA family protein n=1 Tax=Salinisphaera sp. Q1T1-3 TaxID=2321229 RepID=UPI000E75DB5E|nr:GtrA family protein [Salinisphaera sp. Q1T1-3]RJS93285.1 GtrA family protein [Salinisphaera sp. Q1T1-3]